MTGLITFEDIEPGTIVRSKAIVLTREAIVAFATMYDPQPFHLDEAAAKASILDGLAASGWQTTAVAMRLFFDCLVKDVASMGSPGFDEVRWVRPVRPDDPLSLICTVKSKRESASKPDRGFVDIHLDLRNGADETVMVQRGPVILQKRGAIQQGAPVPFELDVLTPEPPTPEVDLILTAFFDEAPIGHETVLGTQLFTPELIKNFASLYDPQYFHLDAEAAKQSHFGGLIASGWQTGAFWMKHYIAARDRSGAARAASGLPVAVGGPSPGFTAIKWLRPVHAGQRVTYRLKIRDKRKILRGGWSLIMTENTGHAQDGTLVFSFQGKMLWPAA